MESIDARKKALLLWLSRQSEVSLASVQSLAGDASFRRYFRLYQVSGSSLIAMDAPPPRETVTPFMLIADTLRARGLHTPAIIASDIDQGFLLLTDFGDATYLTILNQHNADQLYTQALDALAILQATKKVKGMVIPPFTRDFMWQEWAWHQEWFIEKFLHLPPLGGRLDSCMQLLIESAATQPQVFMHRDYHSANLMRLPEGAVGILDFQDAFMGPVTYDLASLLRDCYIDWSEERVDQWVTYYYQTLTTANAIPGVSLQTFAHWFDFMCIQRHLKALLTFARKHVRDGQSNYLDHIPRTLRYLLSVTERYPELAPLYDYIFSEVKPSLKKAMPTCAL